MGPLVPLLWAPVEARGAVPTRPAGRRVWGWLLLPPRRKEGPVVCGERNGHGSTYLFHLFTHPFTHHSRGHRCVFRRDAVRVEEGRGLLY